MINITSPNKLISYNDSKDHFENGLLRLLSLDYESFNKWLEYSEHSKGSLASKLRNGFFKLRNINDQLIDNDSLIYGPQNVSGVILHKNIYGNKSYGIGLSNDNTIGWLINSADYSIETNPPFYEEDYFEGNKEIFGGYGKYFQQSNWRLDKAIKQVNDMQNITGITSGKVLDIGSGYGYFRKALSMGGFNHDGIEVSRYAVDIAKDLYNFDTYCGLLSDYCDNLKDTYDVVTLWDVIEHVYNPEKLLEEIYKVVKPGGYVIIKTPNINCLEGYVFGSAYHSFKREHLIYFSNDSLSKYAINAGFSVHESKSISHLLVGFFGKKYIKEVEQKLNGSDLIMYLKKKI